MTKCPYCDGDHSAAACDARPRRLKDKIDRLLADIDALKASRDEYRGEAREWRRLWIEQHIPPKYEINSVGPTDGTITSGPDGQSVVEWREGEAE